MAHCYSKTFHLALILCTMGAFHSRAHAGDWPQFLGPNRDGTSSETGLQWDWAANRPKTAWSLDVGAGFAGVAVAGGKVCLFHRVGDNEVVQQLDASTGKPGWKYEYPTRYVDDFNFDPGPRATPLISGGRVFTLGPNGDLHALTLDSGVKVWSRNVLKDYGSSKGFFGAACSPILAGDRLLINVGGKGAGIVAFDPATGKELWKATSDAASYSSPVVAKLGDKTLAIFLTREGLQALDPASGMVVYSYPWRARLVASVNAATPLVWNGEVFLTASYNTGAVLLRPKGAELDEVWSNDRALSCHYNTPVRVGDHLYGVHGRQEGGGAELRCVEWKTGKVLWSKERFGCASLIVVDGGILAVTEAGELVRFDADPQKYHERGRVSVLSDVTRAAPALSDGLLFVRDEKKLVCVSLKSK